MVYTGYFVVQSAWPKIQLVSAGALLFFQHGGGGGGGGCGVEKGRGYLVSLDVFYAII